MQIGLSLKAKADRLNGQLVILENNIAKFQAASEQQQLFVPEPSAIEEGELATGYKFAQVQFARRKAKADRERRLIASLKNQGRKL